MPSREYGIADAFAADSVVCDGEVRQRDGTPFLSCNLFKGKYNLSSMASTKLVIRAPLDCGVGSDAVARYNHDRRRGTDAFLPDRPTRTTIVCKPRGARFGGRSVPLPRLDPPPRSPYEDKYGRRLRTFP